MADSMFTRVLEVFAIVCLSLVFGLSALIETIYHMLKNRRQYFYKKDRPDPPACLNDPTLGEHKIVTLPKQAIKLHYVTAGSDEKPLMLLVHGFPEFWYSWRYQIREFKNSYKVVAVDTRGYGHSDHPQGLGAYLVDKLRDDIKELITVLGYDKCVLVGHDWGGVIAWHVNAHYPHLVDRLIVMNSPHPLAAARYIQGNKWQIFKSWYVFVFQWPYLPELILSSDDYQRVDETFRGEKLGAKQGSFTDQDIEAYKYTLALDKTLTSCINYYRANLLHKEPAEAERVLSRRSDTPVLMIWGDGDALMPRGMAELSGDYVREECYSLHYVSGASHWVQQEEPERCNQLMRAFLTP